MLLFATTEMCISTMFDGGISLLDTKFLNEFTKKSPFKTVHLETKG